MAEKITFNTGAKNYEIVDQDGNELGVFRFIYRCWNLKQI